MKTEFKPREMCDLLKRGGDEATIWDTGGGCRNPVIVVTTDPSKASNNAVRYVMFSVCWSREEASLGFYDEVADPEGGWEQAVVDWSGAGDDVPMDEEGILALVARVIGPRCAECACAMGPGTPHPIGDEFPNERVCNPCAGLPLESGVTA
jgi:hypothetical protein